MINNISYYGLKLRLRGTWLGLGPRPHKAATVQFVRPAGLANFQLSYVAAILLDSSQERNRCYGSVIERQWVRRRVPDASLWRQWPSLKDGFPLVDNPWSTVTLRNMRMSGCCFAFWSDERDGVDQSNKSSGFPGP
jgi:hypothetical protein